MTVNLSKSAPANFTGAVTRTYLITTVGGSGLSASLRLHYQESELGNNAETALQLWKLNGGSWRPQGQTMREGTDDWVELDGVTSFSAWTLAACSVLSSRAEFFNERGGQGSVNLTLRSSCGWQVTGVPAWISLTSADSGNTDVEISFEVRENFTRSARQATLVIAEIAYTVVQDGGLGDDCRYAIFPTFAAYSGSGGSGVINVVAEERCAWQGSSNVGWITIQSVPIGIGNGVVGYTVAPNPSTTGRPGVITIAGKAFAVKQKGN